MLRLKLLLKLGILCTRLPGCVRAASRALIRRFWMSSLMLHQSRSNVDSSTRSPCKVERLMPRWLLRRHCRGPRAPTTGDLSLLASRWQKTQAAPAQGPGGFIIQKEQELKQEQDIIWSPVPRMVKISR